MTDQFLTFKSFADPGLAEGLSAKLTELQIEHKVEKAAHLLDSNIAGYSSLPDIAVKIRQSDFSKAHKALDDYYKSVADSIEPGYYLFSFTDKELIEILEKPDEWNPLDVHLSQKILAERGIAIAEENIEQFKSERFKEIAQPEKAATGFIITGYFFLLGGFINIISIFLLGTVNAIPGGLIFSILIGSYIYKGKKTLPDGNQVYTFIKKDRSHGEFIFKAGIIFFILSLVFWLLSSSVSYPAF